MKKNQKFSLGARLRSFRYAFSGITVFEEKKPEIKLIEDLAAASVLISAIAAMVMGCIIFIPKL